MTSLASVVVVQSVEVAVVVVEGGCFLLFKLTLVRLLAVAGAAGRSLVGCSSRWQ